MLSIDFLLTISALLTAVICHEYAHGWVADKCGDPTARLAGRLTLNPLKHIDPVGTFMVPLVLHLLHIQPIGWARPVPVNFSRLNNPKQQMIWVALAGPGTNFLLAVMSSLLLKFFPQGLLGKFLIELILLNLLLGLFNLIPIPPLDGSRMVLSLLPRAWARTYSMIEPLGMVIVLVLLNFGLLNFIWLLTLVLAAILGVQGPFQG